VPRTEHHVRTCRTRERRADCAYDCRGRHKLGSGVAIQDMLPL